MTNRPLTTQEFAKVRQLFHQGCDLLEGERAALLESLEPGETPLRDAVAALFNLDDSVAEKSEPGTGSLARELLENKQRQPAQLDCIGPYQILRTLGEGGMGVAYLARQSNPEREVALKTHRIGSDSLRSRFEREIRALARLQHPGIGQIFEAGTANTAFGDISYFAMEYVDGQSLMEYAAGRTMTIAQKLELMAKVADAVQHAHSNGVIHRDLKPSNILIRKVTGSDEPQPVILDFGVARVLEPDTGCTQMTEAGLLIGTIAFMSPEQLTGDNASVDARADIYAMGVLLSELLTGRMPFDIRNKAIGEAAIIITTQPPLPLSEPATGQIFDRDIETIVAKAMAKERERRYLTAAAFAEDIRRHLRHEPILARPATVMYQLSRFARRNRGLVASATVAVTALVVALCVSISMYFSAEKERLRADSREQLSSTLQDYLIDDLLKAAAPDRLGQDATILQVVMQGREELGTRFKDQPLVEAKVRRAMAEVLLSLGKTDESKEELEAAVALLETAAGPNDPATVGAMAQLGNCYLTLQQLKIGHQLSEETLRRAELVQPPDNRVLIQALKLSERSLFLRTRFAAAKLHAERALQLVESTAPVDPAIRLHLMCEIMGCEQRLGNPDRALEWNNRITSLVSVTDLAAQSTLPIVRALMVNHLAAKRFDEAIALARQLETTMERSTVPAVRGALYRQIVRVFERSEQPDVALEFARKAYDSFLLQYPDTNEQNVNATKDILDLYRKMPDRSLEMREWGLRLIGHRLMLSGGQRGAGVAEIRRQINSLAETAAKVNDAEYLELLWSQREILTPDRHPARAMYLAGYAILAADMKSASHFEEALAEAEKAVVNAVRKEASLAAIEAARARK